MTSNIVAVWRSRAVLGLLVRRDLTVKYQQSFLGYLWSLLEPLMVAATYWFIFGFLYKSHGGPRRLAVPGLPGRRAVRLDLDLRGAG